MPKSDLDVRLQSRISDFVEEINDLVREAAVEAVQEALTEGKGRARRSPTRKATKARKTATKKRGKRVRRSGAQVDALAARALTAIKRKSGRRLGEIAKELRVATKDVRRPVQTLLDEKKVKTTGQRGGTRYFPGGAGGRKKAAKKRRKTTKMKAVKRKTGKGATKAKAA